MKKYELIYDDCNEKEILEAMKNIIINRHPIVDERINTLLHSSSSMQININFYKENNKEFTNIMFLDGTDSYKSSIPERININGLVSSSFINKFIAYIVSYYDIIRTIHMENDDINMLFACDLKNSELPGIDCNNIGLELDFYGYPNNEEIMNNYFKNIVTTFKEYLTHSEWYKNAYKEYLEISKTQIIDSLSDTDLHEFIGLLSNNEIKEILFDMPNDKFKNLYMELQENQKKLIKK